LNKRCIEISFVQALDGVRLLWRERDEPSEAERSSEGKFVIIVASLPDFLPEAV